MKITSDATPIMVDQPERFPQLPALAERLGIKPGEGAGNVWMQMNDGRKYDVFALVNAALDKLELAS